MGSYEMERMKNANDKQQQVTETYNDIKKDTLPGAFQSQNIGHNSKKEGFGPNTIR